MELLLFDQNFKDNYTDYIAPLTENIKDFNASFVETKDEAIDLFKKNNYDMVIIDFSTEDGSLFLTHVLSTNEKQKIITLGYELKSSYENCNYCKENFNKRRLMKPISVIDLYKTIMEFDSTVCKYSNRFDNPYDLIEDFIHRYDYFQYNKKDKIISRKNSSIENVMKDFIYMVEDLKRYHINFEIISEYTIKII